MRQAALERPTLIMQALSLKGPIRMMAKVRGGIPISNKVAKVKPIRIQIFRDRNGGNNKFLMPE